MLDTVVDQRTAVDGQGYDGPDASGLVYANVVQDGARVEAQYSLVVDGASSAVAASGITVDVHRAVLQRHAVQLGVGIGSHHKDPVQLLGIDDRRARARAVDGELPRDTKRNDRNRTYLGVPVRSNGTIGRLAQ